MLKQRKQDFPLDLNKKMNVAYINLCTEAEGPYKRMAIWFQGCNILCEGCCNPELQPIVPAHIMTVQEVIDIAKSAREDFGIEGVTFLGGEPVLQDGLVHLVYALKETGLGVILFTGKTVETLDNLLINQVDLIIDGRFDENQIDESRNLIGSKNQRLHFVTDRYINNKGWFFDVREKQVEINLSTNALVTGDVV